MPTDALEIPPTETVPDDVPVAVEVAPPRRPLGAHLMTYFWVVLKNVIGWLFILSALPVGISLPGPGGVPLFLIGFALVSFPGKRKITTSIMRGRPVRVDAGTFTFAASFLSVAVSVVVLWVVTSRYGERLDAMNLPAPAWVASTLGIALAATPVTAGVLWLGLKAGNYVVLGLPKVRRMTRPWLRRRGIRLLPPRRHLEEGVTTRRNADEILEIDERHQQRLARAWQVGKPWLRRALVVAATAGAFAFILGPIVDEWDDVRAAIGSIHPARFAVAALMFAAFLVGRSMLWRELLAGLGHRLPAAPAARAWSVSELARYVPGVVWQVVGRVMLLKPYGVRGSVCSTSQVLELALFLLANVLVATAACFYFGWRNLEGAARYYFLAAAAMVPLLAAVVWPPLFYGVADKVLGWIGRDPLPGRVRAGRLLGVLLGYGALLGWQGLALWVVTSDVLQLPIQKWWVVAGAYCLAWTAGFVAIWAPGGLGVRELVFVLVMRVALPESAIASLDDPQAWTAFLAFLAVLLRLWATAGELVVAGGALLADPPSRRAKLRA